MRLVTPQAICGYALGLYPFARLHSHSGQPFAAAMAFHSELLSLQHQVEQKRTALRLSYATRPSCYASPITLSRFRKSPRYQGRPAAADMAFCIAACSQGWSKSDIAAALSREYLSRDTDRTRQAAYIRRTLSKALRWAA